jgi:hypothetical protein
MGSGPSVLPERDVQGKVTNKMRRFSLNTPQVVAEALEGTDIADGEAIIVNLATGTYYSIRGDSILVWKAIVAGASPEEITEAVVEETGEAPERVAAAISGFCESLAADGLILERHNGAEPPPTIDLSGAGSGLLEPSFETYTDMQDLILMDPVHEVDERGWPHTRAAS